MFSLNARVTEQKKVFFALYLSSSHLVFSACSLKFFSPFFSVGAHAFACRLFAPCRPSSNHTAPMLPQGLRNAIKSWWRAPKKDESSSVGGGPRYAFDAIETQVRDPSFLEYALVAGRQALADYGVTAAAAVAFTGLRLLPCLQVRLLADFAFMVQDYEMALGLYRIAKDDYKVPLRLAFSRFCPSCSRSRFVFPCFLCAG
jgi:hypothetical protein